MARPSAPAIRCSPWRGRRRPRTSRRASRASSASRPRRREPATPSPSVRRSDTYSPRERPSPPTPRKRPRTASATRQPLLYRPRPPRPVIVAHDNRRDRPRSSPLARRLRASWASTGRGSTAAAAPAGFARSTSSRPRRHEAIVRRSSSRGRTSLRYRGGPSRSGRRAGRSPRGWSRAGGRRRPSRSTPRLDATNLVNLRTQFKAASLPGREVPGYTEFVVKLAAMALSDHPMLHARWDEDRLVIPEEPHIGIAVDTEEGLLVPVIRGAARLGLGRDRRSVRGTWSGAPESDGSGPMRCRAAPSRSRTWARSASRRSRRSSTCPSVPSWAWAGSSASRSWSGEQVVVRERMGLSLTFDHRIVDGAPAARFLQSLVRLIENPGPWLIA